MPPKKKVKTTLANCWDYSEPTTSASTPSSIATPISTISVSTAKPENSVSSTMKMKNRVGVSYIWDYGTRSIGQI
jgi:hypothetical protein